MKINDYKKHLLSITIACSFFALLSAFKGTVDDVEGGHSHDPSLHKEYIREDKQWGTLFIEVTEDIGKATNRHLKLTVSVQCRQQKKNKRTLNPPQKVQLSVVTDLCDVAEPGELDPKSKVLQVNLFADSGTGDSFAEVCDIPMSQTFDLKKICQRWAP